LDAPPAHFAATSRSLAASLAASKPPSLTARRAESPPFPCRRARGFARARGRRGARAACALDANRACVVIDTVGIASSRRRHRLAVTIDGRRSGTFSSLSARL
jgi:hypothetical protein